MKSLGTIFSPEISPIHKMTFSVATQLKLTAGELTTALTAGYIPAGKLLATKSATDGDTIISNPTAGASVTVADGKAVGILAHDVPVEAGVTDYSIGVMISGEVYEDVMTKANGASVTTANKEALAKQNILFYNVKTLKK